MAIQLDTLDQISAIIRHHPDVSENLRALLVAISELPEYEEWLDEKQFAGRHFRLPRHFAPRNPDQRRLLEKVALVTDDLLRVRINVDVPTRRVFLTDGLFAPAQFRVFPWLDESDRIQEHYMRLKWDEWADTILDPATGCGHNLMRYPGTSIRRLGFDVSFRALAFARLNAQLNRLSERDGSEDWMFLGLNDVQAGVPGFRAHKRALFLVNMPFALEPIPDTLAPTAAGGENGYELTVAALRAIRKFVEEVRSDTQVRAVVLTYSVGSEEADAWVVPEEARRLFPDMTVRWSILYDQQLWRIDGKKEQPNPMPLAHLSLKANCKYYVRDPSRRDEVRRGYEMKTWALLKQKHTHLAYGVLDISESG